ncbi:hypothetical protein F1642_04830 [Paracoccus sp. NBH48]|uniref:hypothetical protein n=1 Tax=Paracoccus sp. NBH48 TaxID=2596918 RepID=UPI001891CCA8|nr:hypothetical protein [Paracoccus sp. NBH48]MBF5078494.1 hypothetical protein [Paracoccus sp. NBH48]
MTRKHLASTAALIAVMAGTVPAIAQTPGVELPSMLQGLDLDRISFETKRDGQREYEGYLRTAPRSRPSSTWPAI